MKKRMRGNPIQFWVSPKEEQKIRANMRRSGMTNLSEFLRILALAKSEITFSVKMPRVIEVSDAQLGTPVEGERDGKRATG